MRPVQDTVDVGVFLFEVDDFTNPDKRRERALSHEVRREIGLEIAADPHVVAVWFSIEDDGTPEGIERLQVATYGLPLREAQQIVWDALLERNGRTGWRVPRNMYSYNFQFLVPEEVAVRLNVPYRVDRNVRLGEYLKEPTGGPYPYSPARSEAGLPPLPEFYPDGQPRPPRPAMGNVPEDAA